MIPVILCGRTTKIATGVIAALKPEIDDPINPQNGTCNHDNELGSKNYTAIPKAVIMGAGYSDTDVDSIRKACRDVQTPSIPWLQSDTSLPTPPLGPEYGRALVVRIKAPMMRMEKDKQESGKIESTDDIVYY
ncbi:hypothetical protein HYALB_00007345 [Hymenoscyphus albidus]|uniref:Uncharacterized protein n=1 Tax=Hymenoscyphus albidus TaxID=595503 RepID=A0A9N9LDP1_9HELO|nr:hypothetical protein HYALB_00007345 [Hymenoscyphus albidus]